MNLHATVSAVTTRIVQRSQPTRAAYLQRLDAAARRRPGTERMGCANVAHAPAAMPEQDKAVALPGHRNIPITSPRAPNIAIVTAYNDMLSAHAPLQGKGFKLALVTDGRMSGASGKVPAAIYVSPAAAAGGPLARLQDGDLVRLDALAGTLQALVPADEWAWRPLATMPLALVESNGLGMGRELFTGMRCNALSAEEGACSWL